MDSLARGTQVGSQAFVAMWFHKELEPRFDEGIKPALRECGYSAYRVDRQAHANRIDDEIIAQIRASRLMVADFTGLRPNAFYEAGFAHGLGIPMIICCHQDQDITIHGSHPWTGATAETTARPWFAQVAEHAFDIRQYTMLSWKKPAELAVALENRIRALKLNID